jgi:hypothetical protein
VDGSATLTLNDHVLGEARSAPFETDVTALLQPHNRLEMLVDGNEIGEVALEIRATAFLQGVRVQTAAEKLRVEGIVAGTCAGPLELYFLVDGRHAHYRPIEAGQSFAVELEATRGVVRVELIHVSSVWHVVELAVAEK